MIGLCFRIPIPQGESRALTLSEQQEFERSLSEDHIEKFLCIIETRKKQKGGCLSFHEAWFRAYLEEKLDEIESVSLKGN